jgi:hypothetical protein
MVEDPVSYTILQSVELALLVFEPDKFISKYISSVDDVAEHRSRLRICAYSDFAVEHFAELIWERVRQKRRKNLVHGLRAIKWVLRNRVSATGPIPSSIVDRLFELYQHFVFDRLDDICWCVSAILKDKPLRRAQVRWLIAHDRASEHVVNRLLRYPKFDPLIAAWARSAINRPELRNRRSELVGRLIVGTLPPEANQISRAEKLWAVYYSSAGPPVKERLIKQLACLEVADDFIEISLRLGLPAVIHSFRDSLIATHRSRSSQMAKRRPGGTGRGVG